MTITWWQTASKKTDTPEDRKAYLQDSNNDTTYMRVEYFDAVADREAGWRFVVCTPAHMKNQTSALCWGTYSEGMKHARAWWKKHGAQHLKLFEE